jgi:hypothetical protein
MLNLKLAKQECWGMLVSEAPDAVGQICDYASTKLLYQAWSEEFAKATGGLSLGTLRLNHGLRAVGKLIAIEFHDADKAVNNRMTRPARKARCRLRQIKPVVTGVSELQRFAATVEEAKRHWDTLGKPYPPHLLSAIEFIDRMSDENLHSSKEEQE